MLSGSLFLVLHGSLGIEIRESEQAKGSLIPDDADDPHHLFRDAETMKDGVFS